MIWLNLQLRQCSVGLSLLDAFKQPTPAEGGPGSKAAVLVSASFPAAGATATRADSDAATLGDGSSIKEESPHPRRPQRDVEAAAADPESEVVHSICLEYPCEEPGHVRTTDVPQVIQQLSSLFGELPPAPADLLAVLRQLDPTQSGYVSSVSLARFWTAEGDAPPPAAGSAAAAAAAAAHQQQQ